MEALGMIETRDLIVLTEASDVVVRVTHVKLVGAKQTGGGLCTATIRGDVAAYKVATDADTVAAQYTGELVPVYIISCSHGNLEEVFPIGLRDDNSNP